LLMSLLMMVSFLFSAVIAFAGAYLHGKFPLLDGAWQLGISTISPLVIAVLFALIYRVVPDARVTWREVWPGSSIAAVLFVFGKFVLGLYFGLSTFATPYGAAGSLIIVLAWVFYSAQIMLFGAEFTHVYALQLVAWRVRSAPAPSPPQPASESHPARTKSASS
jgi:membrane protein